MSVMEAQFINSPCFRCESRKEACHSTCEKYKQYRKKYTELKKDYLKEKSKRDIRYHDVLRSLD